MPFKIVRHDITKMEVDAIVNAANKSLLGGGGVDGAIHRAAGRELLLECKALGGCNTGEAKITHGYKLPAKYVIHTVGPIYRGGNCGERELLESCYRNSLKLAEEHGCESVAFPLISSGAYGYPKDLALKTAVRVIGSYLLHSELTVYLVLFDRDSFNVGAKLFPDIAQYISDHYIPRNSTRRSRIPDDDIEYLEMSDEPMASAAPPMRAAPASFEWVSQSVRRPSYTSPMLDESFSEMLLRKIDELGITDAECYKRANIDRKHFSKIRGNREYRPSKPTALAFAIALRLSLDETNELLRKAGFALSRSILSDVIVEGFIANGNYNIFEINEALFCYDQVPLS